MYKLFTFLEERQPISEPLISCQKFILCVVTCRSCNNVARDRARLKAARSSPLCWCAGFPRLWSGFDLPRTELKAATSWKEKAAEGYYVLWKCYSSRKGVHLIGAGMPHWKSSTKTWIIHLGGPQLNDPCTMSTWSWRTWRGQPRSWSGSLWHCCPGEVEWSKGKTSRMLMNKWCSNDCKL